MTVFGEFLKLGRRMTSSLSKQDLQDLVTVVRQLGGEQDRARVELLLKKVRYLLRDHPSLIAHWNSVSLREFRIEPVDERQREAYENLERRLGKYVSLVNDVKNRVPDGRVYVRFLDVVVRNCKEADAAGRIYKEGAELLEGCPDLVKRLADVLELPEFLAEDGESSYYLSAEDVEELRRRRAAGGASSDQEAAATD